MLNKLTAYYKKLDWLMLLPVLLLTVLSLVELYSISLSRSAGDLSFFKRQAAFALIGIVVMFALIKLDYYFFYSFSHYFYLLGLILLVAVLLFGSVRNNTKGWFDFFGLGIQPVEFVKFVLIIFLSRYLSGISTKLKPFKNLIVTGFGTGLLASLIIVQPDLGSAALLFFSWLFMLFVSGLPKRYFLILLVILAMVSTVSWQWFLADYQKQRINVFLNNSNEVNSDYNVNQAIIAVGSGGLFGRGLGFGSQSQLKFLPEANTDFIFAVISEELGFLGVMVTIGLFLLFYWRIFKNLANIKNDFGYFLVLGLSSLIFIEMFINIGMNLGLIPVVGIALPFLSYGGSSLIMNLAMVGTLQSVIIRSKIKQY